MTWQYSYLLYFLSSRKIARREELVLITLCAVNLTSIFGGFRTVQEQTNNQSRLGRIECTPKVSLCVGGPDVFSLRLVICSAKMGIGWRGHSCLLEQLPMHRGKIPPFLRCRQPLCRLFPHFDPKFVSRDDLERHKSLCLHFSGNPAKRPLDHSVVAPPCPKRHLTLSLAN